MKEEQQQGGRAVWIERGGLDAAGASAVWAAERLAAELRGRGVDAALMDAALTDAAGAGAGGGAQADGGAPIRITAACADDGGAPLLPAGLAAPDAPESYALWASGAAVRALACDERGLVYALLELADRVRHADDPLAELTGLKPQSERPAVPVRSIARLFVSEPEDKPWYYDKAFWDDYLTELAAQRFNRFSLTFGTGYDYGHDPDVRDNYMYFVYPFLLDVPGYGVKVADLPDGEAARNLEMLQYIGAETKRRGLDFHIGVWANNYDVVDSPNPHYVIEGLDRHNHAAYCRDALALLLELCPSIDGLTLRVHYESGIPEPAHEFWRTVLSGIADCPRTVSIDLHAKGLEQAMIDQALETGKPVTVSPKYWAEHMGLPYHPTANREREMPDASFAGSRFAAVTAGSRKVTRYGYADFLLTERRYEVLYRIWPGTQRLLLWGDPLYAAAYARAARFGGGVGMELFEPLSFKGRKTSGVAGGREPYADQELKLDGQEWRKYRYTYRLWGRLLYNPEADPSVWRRFLRSEYGAAADQAERALAPASRILPLVTVAHHPSSANVDYWPEMYINLPLIRTKPTNYDYDLPETKTFGGASPLDPGLFYGINDYADALISGGIDYRMTPPETAAMLDRWAEEAERSLTAPQPTEQETAPERARGGGVELRRLSVDVRVLSGVGRFFAAKLRAATAYALFERTNEAVLLAEAISLYKLARAAWAQAAAAAVVYNSDLAFGHKPAMRGHWTERLVGIDEDVNELERLYAQRTDRRAADAGAPGSRFVEPDGGVYGVRRAECPAGFRHTPPGLLRRGEPLEIAAECPGGARVRLHYRRANQAERFRSADMLRQGDTVAAEIDAAYTDSPYGIIYFFEVCGEGEAPKLLPGFDREMANQPYYFVAQ